MTTLEEQVRPAIIWHGQHHCDFCKRDVRDVGEEFVNGRTIYGPWAVMCADCYPKYGIGIGTGKGQVYNSETMEKTDG